MIESSLSGGLLKNWQRHTIVPKGYFDNVICPVSTKSNLTLLIEFLKSGVSGEERLKLARSGFEEVVNKEKYKEKSRKRDIKLPTVADLLNSKVNTCLFRNKSHESKDCLTTRSLSLQPHQWHRGNAQN